jgi:hypothetical protein
MATCWVTLPLADCQRMLAQRLRQVAIYGKYYGRYVQFHIQFYGYGHVKRRDDTAER